MWISPPGNRSDPLEIGVNAVEWIQIVRVSGGDVVNLFTLCYSHSRTRLEDFLQTVIP